MFHLCIFYLKYIAGMLYYIILMVNWYITIQFIYKTIFIIELLRWG